MRLSLPFVIIIGRIRHGISVSGIRIHLLRRHLIPVLAGPLHHVLGIRGRRRRRKVRLVLSILILRGRGGVGRVGCGHGVVVRLVGRIGVWRIHGRVLSERHVHGMRRVHIRRVVRIVRVGLIVIMQFLLFGRKIALLFISLYFPIFFEPLAVLLLLLVLPVMVPARIGLANPPALPLACIPKELPCACPSTTSSTIWLELLDSCS